ncbi:uncharacterized protein LTR77_010654 [Saxophila tyrrhenica]|uniref:Malate dehydrogenase n=1 Tax=Saxophila tyrrhenica TaxID=1690608 RepID=A0AAV9NUR9_9PEZI|nr:hypothetical protein LTR77_010654 [Saxophila tyrrhenica]
MSFSRATLVVASILAITVSARPAEKRWGGWGGSWSGGSHHWWNSAPAPSSGDFGKRWGLQAGSCDMAAAVQNMNLAAADPPLPPPHPSLSLFQVVVGRGTQNYTCDLSNSTAVPIPVGALATLFDISCVAATAKELLPALSIVALDLPVPDSDDTDSPIMQDMSGHHYFLDDTTPFFNMDTELHQYGMGALQKANASDAPNDAYAGPGGTGNGAVQWLKLDVKPAAQDSWKQVYRLDTAGGVPPETCEEATPTIEVPYAAVYWLFK